MCVFMSPPQIGPLALSLQNPLTLNHFLSDKTKFIFSLSNIIQILACSFSSQEFPDSYFMLFDAYSFILVSF